MAYFGSAKASATGGNLGATVAGVPAGCVLVSIIVCDAVVGSLTITQPAGWEAPVDISQGAPDGAVIFFSYKKLSVGGGSDSFTWTTTATGEIATVSAAFTGRDTTSPLSTTPVSTNNTSSNTTPISGSFNGITATAGDDLCVLSCADQTAGDGRWSFGSISGFTDREDGVNLNWVSGIAVKTLDSASAGATGALACTITRTSGTGNAGYASVVFALKAAAAADALMGQIST